MRLRLLALLFTLSAGSSSALAQGEGKPLPPSDDRAFAPAPPPVEVVRGHAVVSAHVQGRSVELSSCNPRTRATFVRMSLAMSWRANGAVRSVSVSSPGGAAFTRCVQRALRGHLQSAAPARAGSGRASVILRRTVVRIPAQPAPLPPTPPPPPPPAPPPPTVAKGDLQRCTVDADCVIYFQTSACVAQDPVAVNGRNMTAVRAAFPVRRIECGMGGPQYDKQRMQNEGRYSAACERTRCVVRDAGPRPTGPGGL